MMSFFLINAVDSCYPDINFKKPTFVDYGYNKFTVSPYSDTIAVTAFDTEDGIAYFESSEYKKAFFILSPHYAPQQNINSCGIASAVMILNTVYANNGEQPPISWQGSWFVPEDNTVYGTYLWTEDNFYNKKTDKIVTKDVVEGRKKINGKYVPGVTLDQLTALLNIQGLTATAYHADTATQNDIDNFRTLVKEITTNPTQYMIANYNLNVESALNGGHFSPLAAYDEISDTVLILDTWSAFACWVWIKLEDFYKSMNTKDGSTYRGYILVDAALN